MKLLAQHGAMCGDKVEWGLQAGYIDGAIFSPRDISFENLQEKLASFSQSYPGAELLFDPQYYVSRFDGADERLRLGHLAEDYSYFKFRRKMELSKEKNIRTDIIETLEFQAGLPLSAFISPNILISHSFDSREAATAFDFIANAGACAKDIDRKGKPLYVSLPVAATALIDKREMEEFANEITALEEPPDGFYLLVYANSTEAREEIFNADVIAGWMYLVHVLTTNGFKVINGYSDLISPLLGAIGCEAGATGWWSNLRSFSLGRFESLPSKARQPVPRYLCTSLWNRITYIELDMLRSRYPWILNRLETDKLYPAGREKGSMPDRNKEVLQAWDTLKTLIHSCDSKEDKLKHYSDLIATAMKNYDTIDIGLDRKSTGDHLDALQSGIEAFKKLAEF